MRIVSFTTLYPNPARPNFGVFVENRLRHLVASRQVDLTVVAPVRWPSREVPYRQLRHGIEILYPRFFTIPGLGMYMAPFGLYLAGKRTLSKLLHQGRIDLIDAHYIYPDGVAATWIGRALKIPVVMTARGTDINVLPEYRFPRALIRRALARAAGLISVSAALKERLLALGAPPAKVRVLRNGVDLAQFHVMDCETARAKHQLRRPVLLSVGSLLMAKGHDLTIRALPLIPQATLVIVGEGADATTLRAMAEAVGVKNRVRFMGTLPHEQLPDLYCAADVLVHASEREGMANVVLEALASGTPVVGSPIPGMDEVIAAPEAGRIMTERTPEALAAAVNALLAAPPSRAQTRAYAETFSWDATTEGQLAFFRAILATHKR